MLFEPLTLRSLTFPNRVWMSPMCQYSAAAEGPDTGAPADWHFAHLAARAVGGAGLVMAEATAVSAEGRISPADTGLWNDRQEEAWERITRFVAAQGVVPGIQLAHAGRKASTGRPWNGGGPLGPDDHGWTPVGPSPIPFSDAHATPDALTPAEIGKLVEAFATSAERALRAGFRVVEIHGAHGYLIHEFLSPHSNRRTDAYGGTFENRARFGLEVVDAVRAVWPQELPLLFRVSATDWLPEGEPAWTPGQTVMLAAELAARGVDLIDVSSGGNAATQKIPLGPGYQVPFAQQIRAEAGVPVAAVGLITEPEQAEEIVATGKADAVFLGRALLRDPYWPVRASANWPAQYRRGAPSPR
ncbi:NADH:flavin oxidoreductase/NADH oxidase [Herbidospora mongoliensis]|uniref:NADH:flavin oxidoreductase/NADH oxidase n=1 Tax=Herbidospora mongoliensis TaxID=688067 RepID=UPI0008361839|nr:NADH:flavin oxidoreductase/NADH oxidase [Herbidospora mongoliensis]